MYDPRLSKAEQDAIRWLVARQSDKWSDADENALTEWLANKENRQAYARVTRTGALGGARALPNGIEDGHAPRRNLYVFVIIFLALAFLLIWKVEAWWYGVPEKLTSMRGQPRSVALIDGSEIHLDADSELVVQMGNRRRTAVLYRGEAQFVANHDLARPFAVEAGSGHIDDFSANFDVDIRGDQVAVSVFAGRVAMNTAAGSAEITAGWSGGYDGAGNFLPVTLTDIAGPAWRDGWLEFDNELLEKALERVARYHTVRFTLADPELAEIRVSGRFRAGNLDTFLTHLEAEFPVRVRWYGPENVLLVSVAAIR